MKGKSIFEVLFITHYLAKVISTRLTRNRILSGKTEADVLNEVRKEAFYLKGKSTTEDPLEDALNSSISSVTTSSAKSSSTSSSSSSSTTNPIKPKEDWEKWYPMEWIGWVTFGPPCEDPTDLWVNEAISEGPNDIEPKKKPYGRVDQRKKEVDTKASTKVESESNSLKSTQIVFQQNEFAMASRDDDLRHIQFQIKHSRTEQAKASNCLYYYGPLIRFLIWYFNLIFFPT